MAKQLTNITAQGETQIGTVMRRPEAVNWVGMFYVSGTYASSSVNWQWTHGGDTATFFPMKDLSGNAVTSSSASGNDSFLSNMCTGKKNSDHVNLWVNLTGGSSLTNLNVGFYDNQ